MIYNQEINVNPTFTHFTSQLVRDEMLMMKELTNHSKN